MKNFIEIGKTEEEQVEQIKQWVKHNGMQIFIGIAIGLSGIWGWDYYKDYQYRQTVGARVSYLSAISSPNNTTALTDLQTNYTDSSYTQQASLMAAKYALDAGKQQQALDYLLPLTNVDNEFIAHTAKLRAASVALEMSNYDQALRLLDTNKNSAFNALYDQLKGDVYLAQNNIPSAKEYYQLTLSQLPNDSALKNLVQIKLDDLK